jgi:hypothetical protein
MRHAPSAECKNLSLGPKSEGGIPALAHSTRTGATLTGSKVSPLPTLTPLARRRKALPQNAVKQHIAALRFNQVMMMRRENHVKEGFKELILWGAAAYLLAGITLEAVSGILWIGHLIA